MKKLFILPILLSSSLCVADINIKEPLEVQSTIVENQKFSKKHTEKMEKICKSEINASIKATKKINFDKTLASSVNFTRAPDDEKILKKQFENKKREILNTMNELKYKKRDIANKMNELTSEIEALQDFVLTGEEKKRDFYFSVSSGKTHSGNPNTVMNDVSTIINNIDTNLGGNGRIKLVYMDVINPFKDSTIDFQWLGSAALGYHVGGNGKIEFEVINSSVKIKKVSDIKQASLWAIMFNLYYNPNIKNTPIAPYVGIGVGPVNFRFASGLDRNININLPWAAYQAKFGIAYSLIPELKISLGYRYFNIPVLIVDSVATHNVEVGLIFNF